MEEEKIQRLAESSAWLKLLHYQGSKKYESLADSRDFFLSERGKWDPLSELRVLKDLMQKPLTPLIDDKSPLCKFPARRAFVAKHFGYPNFEESSHRCPAFFKFKSVIKAQSASLIFSSYYLNNPSSAFGHLLLRLNSESLEIITQNSKRDVEKSPLLDYGINYSATVTTSNAFVYGFKGLFGLFHGDFTAQPYYYKVREYNDFEARDLWEYHLNLKVEEVRALVSHVWELGSTHFDYFYLDENCAYHILALLEAAVPHLDLTRDLPNVVVPADALRAVFYSPKLVSSHQYRPSIRSRFLHRLAELQSSERKVLGRVLKKQSLQEIPQDFSDQEKQRVLDTALDAVEYKNNTLLINKNPKALAWKHQIEISRSQLPIITKDLALPEPPEGAPHLSHPSSRMGLAFGHRYPWGKILRVDFRFALHDPLDPPSGFPGASQIEFFNVRAAYATERKRAYLDEFTLIQLSSFSPWNEFEHKFSWTLKAGTQEIVDQGCRQSCFATRLRGGGGFNFNLGGAWNFYTLLNQDLDYAQRFSRSPLRWGLGPSTGILLRWMKRMQSKFQVDYRRRFLTDQPNDFLFSLEHSVELNKSHSLRMESARNALGWNLSGAYYFYF